ncbi:MAG: helix-turn-helix domain-containing protein [Actinomycetota bacterium]
MTGNRQEEMLELDPSARRHLEHLAAAPTTSAAGVRQARCLLLAADGSTTAEIAATVGVTQRSVQRWIARFVDDGPAFVGTIAPGRGRPRSITNAVIEAVLTDTLASNAPDGAAWTARSLAARHGVSPASISRLWTDYGVRPWRSAVSLRLIGAPSTIDRIVETVATGSFADADLALFRLRPGRRSDQSTADPDAASRLLTDCVAVHLARRGDRADPRPPIDLSGPVDHDGDNDDSQVHAIAVSHSRSVQRLRREARRRRWVLHELPSRIVFDAVVDQWRRAVPLGATDAGPRAGLNRQAIVEAAVDLGLEHITISAVARAVGVSPSALYRHVDGRNDLLLAAVRHVTLQIPLPPDGVNWADYLRLFATNIQRHTVRFPGHFELVTQYLHVGPVPLGLDQILVPAVLRLRAAGLTKDDAWAVLVFVLSVVFDTWQPMLDFPGAALDQRIEILIAGIQATYPNLNVQ